MFESDSRSARNTEIRVLRELRHHPCSAVHKLGHLAELRRASGQNNSVVDDVGSEFGWRVLQHLAHCLRHFAEFATHRLHEFVRANFYRARQSAHEVATFDGESEL